MQAWLLDLVTAANKQNRVLAFASTIVHS